MKKAGPSPRDKTQDEIIKIRIRRDCHNADSNLVVQREATEQSQNDPRHLGDESRLSVSIMGVHSPSGQYNCDRN